LNAVSASFATTAVTSSFANAFTVAGTLTATTLVVQTITSSVDFVTGSTRFGSLLANTHAFTGSVGMTGSLNVAGTTSTQLKYFLKESNTNAWSIYTDGANGPFYIKDEYNSANRLTIGITGNVGIGTTSPTTKLTIDNSANANTNHIDLIGNSSAGAKGHLGSFGGGTYLTSNYYYASGQNNDTGSLGQGAVIIGTSATAGASSISFALSDPGATSPSTKVNILSNGNVGIGTTSPTATLQVVGPNAVGTFFNAQNSGAGGAIFSRINESSSPYNQYVFNNGNVGIGASNPLATLSTLGGAVQFMGDYVNMQTIIKSAGTAGTLSGNLLITIPEMSNASTDGYGGYSCEVYVAGYSGFYCHAWFSGYINGSITASEATILRSNGGWSISQVAYGANLQGFQFTIDYPAYIIHPTARIIFNKGGSPNATAYPANSITAVFS